jgi:transglutaminase-like putative cysteine protease
MPQAGETGAFGSLWNKASVPVNDRVLKLSRLFVSVNNQKAYQIHDFSALLPFLGSIKLSDEAVAEITASTAIDAPAFLRAQAYDVYTAHGWQSGADDQTPLGAYNTEGLQSLLDRQSVHISVFAQGDIAGDALFTIGQPVDADTKADALWNGAPQNVSGIVSPSSLQAGDQYASTGSVSNASAEALRAAGVEYPSWVTSHFLQLPRRLPARVVGLAEQWTGAEPTAYDKAAAIEARLRAEYPYDLTVADTPPNRDTVDFFLFDLKRGYFDYHASAMVVLLRTLGIPSRLAVGYVLDANAGPDGTFRITEADAFAWPEVYFPGYGWVEFNPTPGHGALGRPAAAGAAAGAEAPGDAASIDPGDLDAAPAFPSFDTPDGAGVQSPSAGDRTGWIIAAIAAGGALVLASSAAGLSYAWLRGLRALDPPARLWGQTVRLASWARAGPAADQTPAEFARMLSARVPGAEGSVAILADGYIRHRYGKAAAGSAEHEHLERAWQRVRAGLLRRLLHLG